jgi:hypothetical protein
MRLLLRNSTEPTKVNLSPDSMCEYSFLFEYVLNETISSKKVIIEYASWFYVFHAFNASILWNGVDDHRLDSPVGDCIFHL